MEIIPLFRKPIKCYTDIVAPTNQTRYYCYTWLRPCTVRVVKDPIYINNIFKYINKYIVRYNSETKFLSHIGSDQFIIICLSFLIDLASFKKSCSHFSVFCHVSYMTYNYRMQVANQSWISTNAHLNFNLLFYFVYFCMSVNFKTSKRKLLLIRTGFLMK